MTARLRVAYPQVPSRAFYFLPILFMHRSASPTESAILHRLESLLEDIKGAKELMGSYSELDSWMATPAGWDALIKPTEARIASARRKSSAG